MIRLDPSQIDTFYRISRQGDFSAFVDWLRDSSQALTRDALRSANPQACGAAALLQDLIGTLDSIPDLYHARKTNQGSAPANT